MTKKNEYLFYSPINCFFLEKKNQMIKTIQNQESLLDLIK